MYDKKLLVRDHERQFLFIFIHSGSMPPVVEKTKGVMCPFPRSRFCLYIRLSDLSRVVYKEHLRFLHVGVCGWMSYSNFEKGFSHLLQNPAADMSSLAPSLTYISFDNICLRK